MGILWWQVWGCAGEGAAVWEGLNFWEFGFWSLHVALKLLFAPPVMVFFLLGSLVSPTWGQARRWGSIWDLGTWPGSGVLCWGWGQDLGSVFGTWGRDLGLGTMPPTRSGGFRGCLGPRGQRLGPGDSVLGWSLGTSHGLDPNLVPGVGTVPPNRDRNGAGGQHLELGPTSDPGILAQRGDNARGLGTHRRLVPILGTPVAFMGTAALRGGDTNGPRASPLAPDDFSRSPPCARAAVKSPPRKKATIKYYHRLPPLHAGEGFCL